MKKTSVKCDKCAYEWEVTDNEKLNEYLYDIKPGEASESAPPAAPTEMPAEPPAASPEVNGPAEAVPAKPSSFLLPARPGYENG